MHRLNLQLLILSIFLFSITIPYSICLGLSEVVINKSQREAERLKRAVNLISEGKNREAEDILSSITNDPLWHGEATFLLARLYKENGNLEKAEHLFKKAIEDLPILKDYALFMLADVYRTNGRFTEAIEAARIIKNPLLLQDARRLEIKTLIAMNREDEAIKVLSGYVKGYKSDTESRFLLATLYKRHGVNDRAIELLKDIYISASAFSNNALNTLRELKADVFTENELQKRAENLFNNYNYLGAKETYERLLRIVKGEKREEILFEIGMCEFRLKRYKEAARTFEKVKGNNALYWQAVALFRIDEIEGFNRVINRFEKEYPHDTLLARLILMLANDLRRDGKVEEAKKRYEKVLNDFPQMQEDALWGLGWMYYSVGDYDKAFGYLTRLKAYPDYKYLYWWLRTCERLSGRCVKDNIIDDKLLKDDSYYGHLIRERYSKNVIPATHHEGIVKRPDGVEYKRIETLALLGMREWAVREIKHALSEVTGSNEFLYLSNLAKELDEYKTIIAFAERNKLIGFPNLLYPLGYWEIVRAASKTNDIDPYLITALIREESRFDADAVSWAGAIGLMQLMPETAKRFSPYSDKTNLYDVKKNIMIGVQYLSSLMKEFKELPYAIAAYNAGEYAIRRWLNRMKEKDMDEFIEDIPYAETRGYVMKVLKSYWRYRSIYGSIQ